MKKFYFLAVLFLTIAGSGIAATVSGTLTYYGPGGPASGHKVYLTDTIPPSTIYRDSTVTNGLGVYSFTMPASITSGTIRVYNLGCGYPQSMGSYTYTGSNMIIPNMSTYCTSPRVKDSVRNSITGAPVYGQKVYIKDSTATSFYLDSAYTDRSGVVTIPIPASILSANMQLYTVACGLQSQTISYTAPNTVVAPTFLICTSNSTVSGTLTNSSTSSAIPYYKVVFIDSSATAVVYKDSTYTNASGGYSFSVPVYISSGNFIVVAQACGQRISNSTTYTGSSLTLNLAVCSSSSATVSGIVTNKNTSAPVAGQMVYLVDSSLIPATIYRDSMFSSASGAYSFTIPPNLNTGVCRVYTMSCGTFISSSANYNGSSLVFPLSVHPGLPATFSGTVYTPTGAPAAGISVVLRYNSSNIANATTSSTGTYSMNIPCSIPAPSIISLGVYAAGSCSFYYYTPATNNYTGANISRIDTAFPAFGYVAGGFISKQGGGLVANAKVYLIDEYYDTTVTPFLHLLSVRDSTISDASGHYSFGFCYYPTYQYPGNYSRPSIMHVKAALQSSDPNYSNFLPTYSDSSLSWNGADSVTSTQWALKVNNVNVSLRGGTNPGGPGFIGGNVLLGANKSSGVGDPLPGRIMLLTTAAGQAIAYTYSDASGQFSFPGLPYGSYLLFGDAGGKTNPPLTITLSQGQASVNNVVFEENSTSFKGHLEGLGIKISNALQLVSVYPNPSSSYISFKGLSGISGEKTLILRDVRGANISRTTIAAGSDGRIGTNNLSAGVYLLQLQTSAGVANLRFIKE